MMRAGHRAVLVFAAAVTLTACGSTSSRNNATLTPSNSLPTALATPDAWAGLYRPLALPSFDPDEGCPATPSTSAPERIGPVLGDGPIYPAFLGPTGVFSLEMDTPGNEPRRIEGRDWWGRKTLWLSDERYEGIALVRGRRIDRGGEVLFSAGNHPAFASELRLTVEAWVYGGAPSGWREWNTGVFYSEPGCYAFQMDGESFTNYVVVEVTR